MFHYIIITLTIILPRLSIQHQGVAVNDMTFDLDDYSLCGQPSEVANGNYYDGPNLRLQWLSCKRGFQLLGPNYATCLPNGEWTKPGKCINNTVKICNRVPYVSNGIVEKGTSQVGARRTITCIDDFTLYGAGEGQAVCGRDGEWKYQGLCVKDCGPVPKITHGSIEEGTSEYGSTRAVYCNRGTLVNGTRNIITCGKTGTWSYPGECSLDDLLNGICKPEPTVKNGYVYASSEDSSSSKTGAKRTFVCNEGYTVSGKAEFICESTGRWEPQGACRKEITSCRNLPVIPNGYLERGSNEIGAIRYIQCLNDSFEVKGPSYIECLNTGRWSRIGICKLIPRIPESVSTVKLTRRTTTSTTARRTTTTGTTILYTRFPPGWTTTTNLSPTVANGCCGMSTKVNSPGLIKFVLDRNAASLEALLKNSSADPNSRDERNRTALMFAATGGCLKCVDVLVNCCANLEARNEAGLTALMLAAEADQREVVEKLLKFGASANRTETSGKTALMIASSYGNAEVVEAILEGSNFSIDVNSRDYTDNDTALILATKAGSVEVAQILLFIGHADVDVKDKDGRTALMIAAANGNLGMVSLLLSGSRKPNLDVEDRNGESALSLALRYGHADIAELLAKEMEDQPLRAASTTPRTVSTSSKLPSTSGTWTTVRTTGSTITKTLTTTSKWPSTTSKPLFASSLPTSTSKGPSMTVFPITVRYSSSQKTTTPQLATGDWYYADYTDDSEIETPTRSTSKISSKWNASRASTAQASTSTTKMSSTTFKVLSSTSRPISSSPSTSKRPASPTFPTIQSSQKPSAATSLRTTTPDWYYDVTVEYYEDSIPTTRTSPKTSLRSEDVAKCCRRDKKVSSTALIDAARDGYLTTVISELIDRNSDPNVKDEFGESTPLMYAAFNNKTEIVRTLILCCAKIHEKNAIGQTALRLAAESGATDPVELLLAYGADSNLSDDFETSPLLIASQNGYLEIVNLLLTYRSDIEHSDIDGNTPLIMAATSGEYGVAKKLVESGANVNARDRLGVSPLMLAVKQGDLNMTRLLVQHGANVDAKDQNGNTPITIAQRSDRQDFVNLLLRYRMGLSTEGIRTTTNTAKSTGKVLFSPTISVWRVTGRSSSTKSTIPSSGASFWRVTGISRKLEGRTTSRANSGGSLLSTRSTSFTTPNKTKVPSSNFFPLVNQAGTTRANTFLKSTTPEWYYVDDIDEASSTTPSSSKRMEIKNLIISTKKPTSTTGGEWDWYFANRKTASSPSMFVAFHEEHVFDENTTTLSTPVESPENGTNTTLELIASSTISSYSVSPAIRPADGKTRWVRRKKPTTTATTTTTTEVPKCCLESEQKVNTWVLVEAARRGIVPTVLKEMFEGNANPNSINATNGWTALMYAAVYDHFEVVEILIKCCASVNRQNLAGKTALQLAAENGASTEIVKFLLQNGAKWEVENEKQTSKAVESLEITPSSSQCCSNCSTSSWYQSESLIDAVKGGDYLAVKNELANFADPNSKAGIKMTTPLMFAALANDTKMMSLLLDCCADLEQRNSADETALLLASRSGQTTSVDLLLRRGANVSATDLIGSTALINAARNGHAKIAEALLRTNCDVNKADDNGYTPLMWAVLTGNIEIVRILLIQGKANISSVTNVQRETALMLAVEANSTGYEEIVRLLLENGADLGARNVNGKTAVDLANGTGHFALANFLLAALQNNLSGKPIVFKL